MTTTVDAFIAEVRAALAPIGTSVFDAIVQGKPPAQYAAVYASTAHIDDDSLCTYGQGVIRVQVTSVASGPGSLGQECRGIAERVRDHLAGRVLIADDWRCGEIEHDYSNPPQRDEDVLDRPTVFATDGYRFLVVRV